MAGPDSLPDVFGASDDVFRASDADREDVIRMLRDGTAEGRLSQDTFLARVDRALRAKSRAELARLHRDLPPRRTWLHRVTGWGANVGAAVRGALPAPSLPTLALPRGPRTVFTIGRSPDCDLPIGDQTVSWMHAELRQMADTWVLVDLGSRNGTRVNGWKVDSGFIVCPGDWVQFGAAAFRLAGS
jgi:hypothetical protein